LPHSIPPHSAARAHGEHRQLGEGQHPGDMRAYSSSYSQVQSLAEAQEDMDEYQQDTIQQLDAMTAGTLHADRETPSLHDRRRAVRKVRKEGILVHGAPVHIAHGKAERKRDGTSRHHVDNQLNEHLRKLEADASKLHLWVNKKPVHHGASKQRGRHSKSEASTAVKQIVHHGWQNLKQTSVEAREEAHDEDVADAELEKSAALEDVSFTMEDLAQDMGHKTSDVRGMTYSFGIQNIDRSTLKSKGVLNNLAMKVDLPEYATVQDAYFYLEAPHGAKDWERERASHDCAYDQSSHVTCTLPYINKQVELYIHATFPKGSKPSNAELEASLWHKSRRLKVIKSKAAPSNFFRHADTPDSS